MQFFLNLMRKNYPREDLYYVWRECRQFFDLFISLLEEYFKYDANTLDIYEILIETITKMKSHDCKEKKGSILEDKTLIGYFNMIERLVNMIKLKHGANNVKLAQVIDSSGIVDSLF